MSGISKFKTDTERERERERGPSQKEETKHIFVLFLTSRNRIKNLLFSISDNNAARPSPPFKL